MQDFKQIKAWQRAHALAIQIHRLASSFSRQGHSALRSQLTRSTASISATIAEGCGASTNKEFGRFLEMAIKSAMETEHHLLAARDHGLIDPDTWQRTNSELVEIRKMTVGYRRTVVANAIRPNDPPQP